jgi:hypothetical protein
MPLRFAAMSRSNCLEVGVAELGDVSFVGEIDLARSGSCWTLA